MGKKRRSGNNKKVGFVLLLIHFESTTTHCVYHKNFPLTFAAKHNFFSGKKAGIVSLLGVRSRRSVATICISRFGCDAEKCSELTGGKLNGSMAKKVLLLAAAN